MQNFFDELSKKVAITTTRREALKVTGRGIVGLFLSSTPIAKLWGQSATTSVVFTAQPSNVVSGAGNILAITLPVFNSGTESASGVTVTTIRLQLESGDDDYAELLAPLTFPISVGIIPTGGEFLVEATFEKANLHVGTQHLLTVRGTYMVGGVTSRFTINQFVTIPGGPSFFIGTNKTDELLLEARTANGDILDYLGAKDSNGLAVSLATVLGVSAQGAVSRYDLDTQGRPVQVFLTDGTTFTMNWSSSTSVLLAAISADGSRQLATTIELSPAMVPASLVNASANSVSAAPAGPVALIHVDICSRPVDNANVVLRYLPPNPFPGAVLPATLTMPGTGTYSVAMPSLGAEVASIDSACRSLLIGIRDACVAARIAPFLCGALVFVPGGAPFIPSCLEWAFLAQTACAINGGGLPPGGPTLFSGFCDLVKAGLDRAAAGNIQMRPVAQVPGLGTTLGDLTPPVPAGGPYPEMTIHVPGISCGLKCCVPGVETCCANTECCSVGKTVCCGTTCCDPALCCGTTCCAPGQRCQNGTCIGCLPGQTAFGQTCCPAGVICSSGNCLCPSGQPMCGGICCASGQTCQNGICTACPVGQTGCGSTCCGSNQPCCFEASTGLFQCAFPGTVCCPTNRGYIEFCSVSDLCCPPGCCFTQFAGAGATCCSTYIGITPQGQCCPSNTFCCPGAPIGCCPIGSTCCPQGYCCTPPHQVCPPPPAIGCLVV